MARSDRRWYSIGGVIVLWYALVLIWAFQPLSETMVGVDQSTDPAQNVTVEFECNDLFASSAGPEGASIKSPQPVNLSDVVFPREPCEFVQSDARRALAFDTIVFVVALALWAAYRWRRRPSASDDDRPVDSPEAALLP